MAKQRRKIDSNGPIAEATSSNTVFVDTSLDTHLVMIISSSDTVSDFKKKILLQHSETFPRIGGIQIHSLQVKRRGHFYHLPDSMLVRSAFNGSKRTWFLFVEASCSQEDEKELLSQKPDGASPRNFPGEISRDIDMEVGHLQVDYQKDVSSDINENIALPLAKPARDIRVLENAAGSDDDCLRDNNNRTDADVGSNFDEPHSPAKKRKTENVKDVGLTVKKKHKVGNKKDPMVDASEKVPSDKQTRQTDGRGELNDTLPSDANWMSASGTQKTSLPEPNAERNEKQKTSQPKPNAEQNEKLDREEDYRDQTNSTTLELVSEQEKMPSLQEVKEDKLTTGVGSKKGKKKQKKIDQVASSEPISIPYGSVFHANLNSKALEADKNEGHGELGLNNDYEAMLSKGRKRLDQGDADGTNEESVRSPKLLLASTSTEAVGSVGSKRKTTKIKKEARGAQPYSTGEGTNIAGAINSHVDHVDDKIENDRIQNESGLLHGHDAQARPSESFKPSDLVEAQEKNKGQVISQNLSGLIEAAEAGNSGNIKRKKRKAKKSASKLQDKSDVENLPETSLPVHGLVLYVDRNHDTTEKNEAVPHTGIDMKNDREGVALPEGKKFLDSVEATLDDKEPGFAEMSLDDKHGLQAGKSDRSRKKKMVKKHTPNDDNFSSMEHSNPVDDPSAGHFPGDMGLSSKHGLELISSQAGKTSDFGAVTEHGSEADFLAQDNDDASKSGKPRTSKKKKRTKKGTNSVCDSSAKHFSIQAQGNQNILSCAEDKQTSKEESRNASRSGASKGNEDCKSKEVVSPLAETDETLEHVKYHDDNLKEAENDQSMDTNALQDQSVKVHANEVPHPLQHEADKGQDNTGNIKKKAKKKTKRNQNTTAETQSNSKANGQNISIEELAASGDKLGDGDHPSGTMNTSVTAETRTGNQSTVSELMLEKNAAIESKISNGEQAIKGADSSEVPSYHIPENNQEGRPETMNIVQTSKAGDEGINFMHYFVTGEHHSGDTSADKVKEAMHTAEGKRNPKKSSLVSEGPLRSTPLIRNESNTNDNQLEESFTDAKGHEDMPLTNKDTSKAAGNVVRASNSRDTKEAKTPSKATKPAIANGCVTASSSSSSAKVSKRALQDTSNKKQHSGFDYDAISARKFSKKNGGIVKSSHERKSLLNIPGAIFSDGSSGSSGDENGIGNSDASTCTPSDNSSSSGYSDGESESSQGSRGNGSEHAKRKDGHRNTSYSKFADPTQMSMDMILRSSKRFKKAKLTASQSQEADTESQPVEFVPDSQAN